MIVYQITNQVNGKFYVGKTTLSTSNRLRTHKSNARRGFDTYLYRAIRKYGEDNFTIIPLQEAQTEQELNALEIEFVKQLNPHYNMTDGGDGGNTSHSPNYKLGMKRRRRYTGKNNPNYGKRGILSPKFGKKYGPKPNISKANQEPVMANGQRFQSVGEAERTLKIKWSYSSRKHPTLYYKL